MARKPATKTAREKKVEALTHEQARRANIPTAEHQSLAQRQEEMAPVGPIRYARVYPLNTGTERPRDKDIDPQIIWSGARIRLSKGQIRQLEEKGEIEIGDAQLTWRGKDQQDWSELVVKAPPLYIQEKVHPKAIIDDLVRRAKKAEAKTVEAPDLFAEFNGLTDPEARTEFYQHSQHWSNRMILGDNLQVMASLAEREHLRGQVQCIYFDPPYGIKFNSNWQVSTLSRDVKDGKQTDISREPEQVRAFRDTWKDGIHSYLTYLRDRLTVARDLLHESGSIFVQIGDENAHRVRALMDEVLGADNFCSVITFAKNSGATDDLLPSPNDYLVWYAKDISTVKFRKLFWSKEVGGEFGERYNKVRLPRGERRTLKAEEANDPTQLPDGSEIFTETPTISAGFRSTTSVPFTYQRQFYDIGKERNWKTHLTGMGRLGKADRLIALSKMVYYERRIPTFQ